MQSQVPNEVCWWLLETTQQIQKSRKKANKKQEKKKKTHQALSSSWKETGTDWASPEQMAATSHFPCSKVDLGPCLFGSHFWWVSSRVLHPAKQPTPTPYLTKCKRSLILINRGNSYIPLLLFWNCECFPCPEALSSQPSWSGQFWWTAGWADEWQLSSTLGLLPQQAAGFPWGLIATCWLLEEAPPLSALAGPRRCAAYSWQRGESPEGGGQRTSNLGRMKRMTETRHEEWLSMPSSSHVHIIILARRKRNDAERDVRV